MEVAMKVAIIRSVRSLRLRATDNKVLSLYRDMGLELFTHISAAAAWLGSHDTHLQQNKTWHQKEILILAALNRRPSITGSKYFTPSMSSPILGEVYVTFPYKLFVGKLQIRRRTLQALRLNKDTLI